MEGISANAPEAQAGASSSDRDASELGANSDAEVVTVDLSNADELYFQAWNSVINRCRRELENDQLTEALMVTSLPDFKTQLENLEAEHQGVLQSEVLYMLYLTLSHYEQFANMFIKMMKKDMNASMMWVLLYLVVKLSMSSKDPLDRINKLLKAIGSSLDCLNEIGEATPPEKMKENSIEVHNEIVVLWLNIILLFRDKPAQNQGSKLLRKIQEQHWKPIQLNGDSIVKMIQDAVEKCLRNSQIFLTKKQKRGTTPGFCHAPQWQVYLPQTSGVTNPNFFGRDAQIQEMEKLLQMNEDSVTAGFPSVVLHGLPGMGKSQIALEFAHRYSRKFAVILWLNGETETSMQLSFSSAAVNRLGLPDAVPNQDAENRVALLKCLQETETNWLVIFDNMENNDTLNKYLPVSPKTGAAIITSRKRIFNWNRGALEIGEFSPDTGLSFIVYLLKDRTLSDADREAALKLSEKLCGHPLAINQMVALMDSKMWSVPKFLRTYETRRPKLLKDMRKEWSQGGYGLLLGNLFSMSFGSLKPASRQMLGVLSFISPDIITQDIFMVNESFEISERLKFCQNEDELDDIVKELLEFALLKLDPSDDTMNIHRLVQDEFKSQLSVLEQQEAFDAAALLLYEAFPKQVDGALFDERMPICARYIQHVYCLRDNLNTVMENDKQFKQPISIIPSTEYVKLMTNAAWYSVERQGHIELESVLENSFQAMIINGMKNTEPLLWAHLCNSAGRLWGQRGYIEKGETYFIEGLKIRKEKLGKGDENIAGLLSNMGNLNLSMARYDTALDFQKQALDWGVVGGKNEISARGQSIITANTARVLTDMGRTKEAWARFEMGDKMLQGTKDPPYCVFYKTRLLLKEGNLKEAKKSFTTCQDDAIKSDGPTSVLVAAC